MLPAAAASLLQSPPARDAVRVVFRVVEPYILGTAAPLGMHAGHASSGRLQMASRSAAGPLSYGSSPGSRSAVLSTIMPARISNAAATGARGVLSMATR